MNDTNTPQEITITSTSAIFDADAIGNIWIIGTNLTSLEGCPEVVVGSFVIDDHRSLASLIGGPKEVGGFYAADRCGITCLEGIPVKIGRYFDIANNPLTSLQGINNLKEMDGWMNLRHCPITSHILGVFFIKGCKGLKTGGNQVFGKAANIVNRHIDKGRSGLLPCQQELIEAGLAEFAQI
jgi:hypothetical protein